MTARGSYTLAMLLVSTCDPPGQAPDASPSPEPDAALIADAGVDATPPEPPCTAQLAAGDHHFTLELGGLRRTYRVHVPRGLPEGMRAPLLLNLHPSVLNGVGQALFSGMNGPADERGVIVAYPDGIEGSWNAGSCCGRAARDQVDDVGFMREMIADLSHRGCIERRRVYATGHSNGAHLAHRLACEAPELIAAIAPASGVLRVPLEACREGQPVPVLQFHGTEDSMVEFSDAGATVDTWVARDGCTDPPREIYRQGVVRCMAHDACRAGSKVVFCVAEGGGHCWPGSRWCPVGAPIRDIDGNHYMLDFFDQFALP